MTATSKPQDIAAIPQALLKRNLSMTKTQFSVHWFEKHAAIVIPYFLAQGVEYYAQLHNPTLSQGGPSEDLEISEWDGAAELIFKDARPEESEAGKKYYQDAILVDERRFLVSEALKHVEMVASGTVIGDRKVIIDHGKVVYELDYEENEKIWEMYVTGKTG
jgi:EthD domain